MLAILRRSGRAFERWAAEDGEPLPSDALWIDLLSPSPQEVEFVQRELALQVPTREEMREIEASARVYEEGDALVLTTTMLVNADQPPPSASELTCILKPGKLITLRYADPQPFRNLASRLERSHATLNTSQAAFFWLVDQIIARLADLLERAAIDVENLSREIFGAAGKPLKADDRPNLVEAISRIGRNGDTAGKIRESLFTIQRELLAVSTSEILPNEVKKDSRNRAKILNRDVQSLTDQTQFLTQKINLLLDATLGLINIEQNQIIKIFSVVAVVFLPPTLIASIYGMNFRIMPELDWHLGYGFALGMMVLSVLIPFLIFRRKGWL